MRKNELDTNLKNKLDNLKQVPGRNPQVVSQGKANFLKQAVSLKANQRQNGWNNNLFSSISTKERLPMLKPIMAVILVIAILFAGTAGTVYAAQGSLPDQALYKVKTWSEDLLLGVTRSPQTQLEQNLNFADRRIMEIAGMQAAGTPIPQQVQTRLQAQLNQALNLAAGMDDQQMIMELAHIRLRTEVQLQMMSMLMAGDSNPPDPVMAMVRTSLQQQLQMAVQGNEDAEAFRMQVQNQIRNNSQAPSEAPGNGQGGPNDSLTTTPMPSGQHNGDGSSSDNGNGPYYNYLTTTPMQSGPYYGQKTPAPGSGNKP